ncbi:PQQ-dependent sugar dehydrogenase [Sphingomonas sp.]|uniref:PQQ-dependent sugar dehydrogenase n=1 Tax=Sphingomonas sp. TaxID=28214 RepID=UPI0025E3BA88|nr:PQQ-dependent sugar dehydrogenase [Sphingomonas sp.]MBV9528842.1 PQQ-dependent sugar dehydrogenase [Sphingomonas sp.]
MSLRLMQPALFLVLAACGSSNSADAVSHAAAPAGNPPFKVAAVATFNTPWALAFLPGSHDALVTEKPGHIWLVDAHTGRKQPVSGAPAVVYEGQGGLLDVALSPTFASDHQVYLTFAEPSPRGGSGLALARASLTRSATGGALSGLKVLWHDPAGGEGGQFGGIVAFAPDGKSLFLSSGERQRFTPAQDPSQPLGKILHLTLEGKPAPGNPDAGRTGAAMVTVTDPPKDTAAAKGAPSREFAWPGPNLTPAETWSMGHRNPYGLAFDGQGRLWETEMGPRGGDELNLIEPGRNYGWPLVSEGENYDGVPIAKPATRPDLTSAKLYWVPSVSPTSLLIYSGNLFPQWRGSGFIGAMSAQALIRVTFDGDSARKADQWHMGARIRFVGQGPDGAIYLLEDDENGRLLRLTPR